LLSFSCQTTCLEDRWPKQCQVMGIVQLSRRPITNLFQLRHCDVPLVSGSVSIRFFTVMQLRKAKCNSIGMGPRWLGSDHFDHSDHLLTTAYCIHGTRCSGLNNHNSSSFSVQAPILDTINNLSRLRDTITIRYSDTRGMATCALRLIGADFIASQAVAFYSKRVAGKSSRSVIFSSAVYSSLFHNKQWRIARDVSV